MELVEETPERYRIERAGSMRVPGIVFISRKLLPDPATDGSLRQVANVATLPGIVEASYAMPDMHWGYGFPIGGVAGTDVAAGGVVSPGGVGFDISCGVRLLAARNLDRDAAVPQLSAILDRLGRVIPRGAGRGAVWKLRNRAELADILTGGARYAVSVGYGVPRDLDRCEDRGAVADADVDAVSARAVERGYGQVGSLGSGNHFLEVQAVDEVYDEAAASAMGLAAGRVCVMIHCGSRGLGHQICTDYVRVMDKVMAGYGITVPDRQLACAPVDSPEGRSYLGAMAAAANYGRANRHVLAQATRQVFEDTAGVTLDLVYDISHNLAKIEQHPVDGESRTLCVHRKGATPALPPGHPTLPADLADAGQPALLPGTMGTASYVLAGVPEGAAFHSTAHGAGRARSRHQAARMVSGRSLRDQLEQQGVLVRGLSWRGLAEESPDAYKDVDVVAETSERAGLARRVVRLIPLGVVKG
ncbi:MAG: RtcB family protein [Actinomycetota bacterium]